jgi:hypothetical protein
MTKLVIQIDYKIKKIQELRVIHAISEADVVFLIPRKQVIKFRLLKDKFNMEYEVSNDLSEYKLSKILSFNHEKPETNILNISSPLIFPFAITEYCKTLWKENRDYHYTFAGLITQSRNQLISNWIKSNITKVDFSLPITDDFFNKWRSKIFNFFNIDSSISKNIGDLIILSSNRGRKFPIKAWDDEYFKVLGQSQFVLCPSGVCIWSYRFFESILCGAIPIVDENCTAYKGFRFKYMSEDASTFIWSKEDAEFNYNLCVERITVNSTLINCELEKLKK